MIDSGYKYNIKRDYDRQIICLSVQYQEEKEILIPFMDILLQLEKYKGDNDK